MKVVGITGGVGMGKSAVGQLLALRDVKIIDSDELARELVARGKPALSEIRIAFGSDVVSADGDLIRDKLASLVFSDESARQLLERILHPRIRERWLTVLNDWREKNAETVVVLVPLLFEAGLKSDFDHVVCVACSVETQKYRLMQRGWDIGQITRRIHAQWPITRKMELSDYVVWTEGTMDVTAEQLKRIFH